MLEKHKLLKSRDYLKSRFHLMAMERSRHNLGTSTTPEQIRSQTPNTVVKRKIEKDTELADDFTATVCNKKFEKLKDRIYRIRTKKKIDGLATLAEDGITFDISAKYLK
jgi:type IV secretory pathway VirD2 relaxase